jgi:hypothetical protein
MSSVFEGMAGALNAVFGAPVTITRAGHAAVTLQAVFREMPIEQEAADGRPIVTITPTVRVPKDAIASLVLGDTVAPSTTPGRSFTVLQNFPGSSPATDAFVTYVLEEVRS